MLYNHRWKQCLINLAVGDALGYPLEFRDATPRMLGRVMQQKELIISDDTQMTLFTCEAIRSGISYLETYSDWYASQIDAQPKHSTLGWHPLLRHQRVPGNTCWDALAKHRAGEGYSRQSKGMGIGGMASGNGCGGLMRIAPIAFAYPAKDAIRLALLASRVTHHGQYADAAAVAYMALLQALLAGVPSLGPMVATAVQGLQGNTGYRMFKLAWDDAMKAKHIEDIGGGFYAHECLLMGLWAAINCEGSYLKGIELAVCHKGDSDSVGAVAGTIMGAMGIAAPMHLWCKVVEAPVIQRYFDLSPYEPVQRAEVGRIAAPA